MVWEGERRHLKFLIWNLVRIGNSEFFPICSKQNPPINLPAGLIPLFGRLLQVAAFYSLQPQWFCFSFYRWSPTCAQRSRAHCWDSFALPAALTQPASASLLALRKMCFPPPPLHWYHHAWTQRRALCWPSCSLPFPAYIGDFQRVLDYHLLLSDTELSLLWKLQFNGCVWAQSHDNWVNIWRDVGGTRLGT